MDVRQLGRTGVKVSPLCLGCMMFGGRTTAEDSYAIIDRAIDAGINFLDTANVYARGRSEEITGEALKRNGKRAAGRAGDQSPRRDGRRRPERARATPAGTSSRSARPACAGCRPTTSTSTRCTGRSPDMPIDETLRALDDLVRAGKVRYIGTSTFGAWQLVESLWVAKELGLNRFVCEQPPYNILDRRIERELLPMAQTYGIAVIPWSPLARRPAHRQVPARRAAAADSRFARRLESARSRRLIEGVYDVVEPLEPLAQEKGCTLVQFALAW